MDAPSTGARIVTRNFPHQSQIAFDAPYTGARIETGDIDIIAAHNVTHPTRCED